MKETLLLVELVDDLMKISFNDNAKMHVANVLSAAFDALTPHKEGKAKALKDFLSSLFTSNAGLSEEALTDHYVELNKPNHSAIEFMRLGYISVGSKLVGSTLFRPEMHTAFPSILSYVIDHMVTAVIESEGDKAAPRELLVFRLVTRALNQLGVQTELMVVDGLTPAPSTTMN